MLMLDIIRTVLRLGNATVAYPEVRPPAPATLVGLPLLDPRACRADGACVRACPASAITLEAGDNPAWRLDVGRCVFCGCCAAVCPQAAIVISSEFELATRYRDDLVVRHPLPLAAGVVKEGNDE
jgi:formate hydrogenlyase subunit 6/NADH:ubiquinone oxidoreductase subunit I